MLKVDKINVSYGSIQILWDVSFEIKEKEIVTIIGSNGAGKTTTLLTLSGVLKPTSGTISFDGHQLDQVKPPQIVELGISQVPEGRRLFPKMTVLENLQLGSYIPRARVKCEEILEQVFEIFPRLEERKSQHAGTLSGGEQQMAAIARGLMSDPKILVLDEPSLGLQPTLVEKTFDTIKTINDRGVTILLVEQNAYEALTLADRGYVLENGRIVLEGTGNELVGNEEVKVAYLGM